MRSTINLPDEAYHFAKALARERDQGLGRTVGELILERVERWTDAPARSRAGFPVFASGKRISSEEPAALIEDETETEAKGPA